MAQRAFRRGKGTPFEYGGVAQLGEHLLCKQGVIGSNPFISTRPGQKVRKARQAGRKDKKAPKGNFERGRPYWPKGACLTGTVMG